MARMKKADFVAGILELTNTYVRADLEAMVSADLRVIYNDLKAEADKKDPPPPTPEDKPKAKNKGCKVYEMVSGKYHTTLEDGTHVIYGLGERVELTPEVAAKLGDSVKEVV